MKKLLALLSILAVMAVPMLASAQGPASQCTLRHDITDIDAACSVGAVVDETATSAWGMCCMLDAVYTVTDWVFIILMAFVAVMIVWGGFTLTTAAGAPDKVASGRNYIIYALIGLAVALLARAFPSVVKSLLGV